MEKKRKQKKKSHRQRLFSLIGVPILLFVSGITLLSFAFFDNMKFAFYISRMFFPQEVAITQVALTGDSSPADDNLIFPKYGDQYGELTIASANIVSPLFVGDDTTNLLYGAGQYFGSVFPGDPGKTVISGHNNSIFETLGEAQIGDTISLDLTYGNYTYEIINLEIKNESDHSIVEPLDIDENILTLYTCYPFSYIGLTPDRYVVTAKLIEGQPLSEIPFEEEAL